MAAIIIHSFKDIIARGTKFLAEAQQPDGRFLSYSSPDPKDFNKSIIFHSLFSNALILTCLSSLSKDQELQRIKERLTTFILKERSQNWTWNYWVRTSKEYTKLPYPDDLDDTFCSLSALYLANKDLISGEVLAHAVNILTYCETQEGGPYITWIVPKSADKAWLDVDLVVQSNIAYFLSLQEINLPNLTKLFNKAIQENSYTSPYYPTEYPFLYFLSRIYNGKKKNYLETYLYAKQQPNGGFGNPLNTALAISTLLQLGTDFQKLKSAIEYIFSTQKKEGYWQPSAFYTGVNPKKDKRYYAGSAALTTAFCLEACSKYMQALEQAKERKKRKELFLLPYESVLKESRLYPAEFSQQAYIVLERIRQIEASTPIAALPYLFKKSLTKHVDEKLLKQLAIANIYGWIAYTIYDDFLDEEGDSKMLSVANVCLRKLTTMYTNLFPTNREFIALFHSIMDRLDIANSWEVTHCRFMIHKGSLKVSDTTLQNSIHYYNLADKSFGHALSPLAILYSLGYNDKSKEIQYLKDFFRHYLIARQLNDDAHDVFSDLAKGHFTIVGLHLMQDYTNHYHGSKVSIQSTKLKKIFWEETIDRICKDIFFHVKQARLNAERLTISNDLSSLMQLDNLEYAAKKALLERDATQTFIKAYKSL